MRICINGEFFNPNDAKISVFDHGLLYGDGVFDTIAAVNGHIWWLDEHLNRLLEGCNSIFLQHPWSKSELTELTHETFRLTGGDRGRIRITITRGVGDIPSYCLSSCQPNLIIFVTPLDFPQKNIYLKGISLKSINYHRVLPQVKNLSFLPSIIGYENARKSGFNDSVFVDDFGYVREGTSWNIFLVTEQKMITPKDSILVGVTRNKVIKLAESLGFAVDIKPVKLEDFYSAKEVFITGTTKRILGVTQIDNFLIGRGSVGEHTQTLFDEFQKVFY
ncbi:MAG: aminotransferase class IV [Nostoc sp. DedSLP03]|uniref:aminotransferase class IV n=1 Tax=Nostoc sp. DedSLP03 TaxID=3075400 RepID=UPI002AD38772|nr:aminotransferase class IV [Nostoc sp. DedSLP03]MDZ7970557.1 aminotransferase class IV [Nostoc sp. DedSLP03]